MVQSNDELRGNVLFNHSNTNDYSIVAPDSPTHFPSSPFHRPDVLEIAIVRTPFLIWTENPNDLSSDHNPILLEVSESPIKSSPPMSGRPINWIKYSKSLNDSAYPINPNLKTVNDVNVEIKKFTNLIITTEEKCSYTPGNRKNRRGLTAVIVEEIQNKNRIQ